MKFPFYFKLIQSYILIVEKLTGKTAVGLRKEHAKRIMNYIKENK